MVAAGTEQLAGLCRSAIPGALPHVRSVELLVLGVFVRSPSADFHSSLVIFKYVWIRAAGTPKRPFISQPSKVDGRGVTQPPACIPSKQVSNGLTVPGCINVQFSPQADDVPPLLRLIRPPGTQTFPVQWVGGGIAP